MQDIQKGCKCVASHIANLSLVHECLVEEVCRVLFLFLFVVFFLITLAILCFLLLHCGARDVESHFHQLIRACCSLATAIFGTSCRLSFGICSRECKLHRHFVLSSKVGIRDLGVWNLEGGSVLNVEG